MQSTPQPPRTPLWQFIIWDPRENAKARKARKHFAYEEFPDPHAFSGKSFLVHPLSLDDTTNMSEQTMKSLKVHLTSTFKAYGNPFGAYVRDTGRQALPRLRLRTLITVCWVLHTFTDLDLEIQEEIFREGPTSALLLEDWKIDEAGNVVDQDGRLRYNARGGEAAMMACWCVHVIGLHHARGDVV